VRDYDVYVIRKASCDDLPSQQAPVSLIAPVGVIVYSITDAALFTAHGKVGIAHQHELGRTSALPRR